MYNVILVLFSLKLTKISLDRKRYDDICVMKLRKADEAKCRFAYKTYFLLVVLNTSCKLNQCD